jgi:hypothetical protein
MPQLQMQIREDIARQTFSIRHVLSDGAHPEFTYTVGLYSAADPAIPELFMSGLSMETRVGFMLQLGFAIKGPPPLAIQQRMAWENGVSVVDLTFPPGGMVFEPGKIYRTYTDNGLPMCFGQVEQGYYETILGQAVVFHGHDTFPALQMVWSDRRGRFPFDQGYDPRPQFAQQLLFDSQRYLPLKEG